MVTPRPRPSAPHQGPGSGARVTQVQKEKPFRNNMTAAVSPFQGRGHKNILILATKNNKKVHLSFCRRWREEKVGWPSQYLVGKPGYYDPPRLQSSEPTSSQCQLWAHVCLYVRVFSPHSHLKPSICQSLLFFKHLFFQDLHFLV